MIHERLIFDLFVSRDRMVPDRDLEYVFIRRERPVRQRVLNLLRRPVEAVRQCDLVDAGSLLEILVDGPARIHRDELDSRLREEEGDALVCRVQGVWFLNQGMVLYFPLSAALSPGQAEQPLGQR